MNETMSMQDLQRKCEEQECRIEGMLELLNLWLSDAISTEDEEPIDTARLIEDTLWEVTPEEYRY